jgi:hypothetical protein
MASSENQEILFLRLFLRHSLFFLYLLCWRYFQFVPSLFLMPPQLLKGDGAADEKSVSHSEQVYFRHISRG